MLKLNKILHPTDFSESAQEAFQLACSLARDHGAELVALHVLSAPLMSVSLSLREKNSVFRGEILRQFKSSHIVPDLRVECHLAEGDPTEQILLYAEKNQCDLIVLGTHGRGGLLRALMGSVAEGVLRGANCPVLTVKNRVRLNDTESKATSTLALTL